MLNDVMHDAAPQVHVRLTQVVKLLGLVISTKFCKVFAWLHDDLQGLVGQIRLCIQADSNAPSKFFCELFRQSGMVLRWVKARRAQRNCFAKTRFDADEYERSSSAGLQVSLPRCVLGTTGPEQQHASRVQQVLDMIASLSDAEKTEVWSSSPNARGMPGDFENIVRALLNSVVSLDHLDENDLRVVADSLIDSLSRLCQGVDLHPFVTQAMHRGIEEGRVDATKVVDAVLLHDKLNPLLWKAPSHLNPDEIQRMGRGCPDKIAKCLAINKLMIQRVVELQPTESRKFWVREGAKPIATSSNERDFFFGVVPKLNLQVAKPVVQECVAWIVANVPVQFKKGASDAPEKRKAESAAEGEVGAPPVKLPKRVDFDFGAYTLEKFELDAPALARSLPGTTLLSVKEASKEQPFDSNSPIHAVAVKFDTALEKLGVEGQIRESVYGAFKMATQNIGLKCDKRQVHELRRWVARALALKHGSAE
eukprot:s1738_g10.t1